MTSGGKPAGVSLTAGSTSCATAMSATKLAAAAIAAFHAPSRGSSSRRIRLAATTATIEIEIIATNSAVRLPIVSVAPVAGGVAGYFVNGTTMIVRYAPSASTAAVRRAP